MTEKKIRPGRITDEQVEAFRRAGGYDSGQTTNRRIRAGLAAAYTRRELENRTMPTLHPGTVSEVADEIARFALELESSPARGVLLELMRRLPLASVVAEAERKMSDCTHGADCTVHPDESRVHNLDGIKGAPEIAAREVEPCRTRPDAHPNVRCDLDAGHAGPHRSGEHGGMRWHDIAAREVDDLCRCSRTRREYCHSTKCHGGADVVEP